MKNKKKDENKNKKIVHEISSLRGGSTNLCYHNNVEVRIPMNIKQYKMDLIIKSKNLGYNIFDLNSSFYKDICSIFTYNNSDISLSERKNILDLSDENLCMIDCIHSNFDIKTIRSICYCKIGNIINESLEIEGEDNNENDEKHKIYDNLVKELDISKSINIKIIILNTFMKNII